MAKMTAAERYAVRKARVASDARLRLLAAADVGARHARLYAKYGPDWRGQLDRARQRWTGEWYAVVERNPYVRPDLDGSEFGRYEWR